MGMVSVTLIVSLVISIVILKRSKKEKSCNLCIVCICVIAFLMNIYVYLQRSVIEYESPEEIYIEIENEKPYNVIEGEETVYVVGNKGTIIVEKDNNGWRYPINSTIRGEAVKEEGDLTIYVEQYNESDEYYVIVLYLGKDNIHITDNRNSYFQKINNQSESHFYCAYVKKIDDEYAIIVNDQIIKLY